MTSIAPLKVAGLIEFQVLDTEPDIDRTYCMSGVDVYGTLRFGLLTLAQGDVTVPRDMIMLVIGADNAGQTLSK